MKIYASIYISRYTYVYVYVYIQRCLCIYIYASIFTYIVVYYVTLFKFHYIILRYVFLNVAVARFRRHEAGVGRWVWTGHLPTEA